jgi:hypothetical protein
MVLNRPKAIDIDVDLCRSGACCRKGTLDGWDYAAELLLKAAERRTADDLEAATAQMERALRVEGWM